MNESKRTIYDECSNDKIKGLKASIDITNDANKVTFIFDDNKGQGYDGCGTHTHQ